MTELKTKRIYITWNLGYFERHSSVSFNYISSEKDSLGSIAFTFFLTLNVLEHKNKPKCPTRKPAHVVPQFIYAHNPDTLKFYLRGK